MFISVAYLVSEKRRDLRATNKVALGIGPMERRACAVYNTPTPGKLATWDARRSFGRGSNSAAYRYAQGYKWAWV